MRIAMLADPHVSCLTIEHCGINLGDTIRITEALIEDINRRSPDMVVWLGDLTHEGTVAVRQRFAELHRRLAVTSVPLPGNHDVQCIDKIGFAGQTVPCARRQFWQMAGWNVVVLDTVRELCPDDPSGVLSEFDLRLVRDVARHASGPLLAMGHHPMRQGDLNAEAFWEAVEPFAGAGVYIGAHTHKDRHETKRGWHVFELASCCGRPAGYHIVEISTDALTITPIRVSVAGVTGEPKSDDCPEVFPVTLRLGRPATEAGGPPR